MNTYSSQKPFNTIGSLLMDEGYFSRAYHNNIYTFYDRHKTHVNLGYEQFIGMGNGMEGGVVDDWPQSDLEMFDFTIPQYIDQQPFSIYYMTVSGHCRYNQLGNDQSKKNWSLVENLPYSDGVKAYIACNLELEKALASLVAQLEQAGIAEDTVIVMAPDHYPYGLGKAWGLPKDGLAELYGVDSYDLFQRDKNTLIIWSGCLEDMDLRIDAPVCSIDILPTLSNLFGVTYDSRLSIGRDVLGSEEAISLWPDYSWVTEMGSYNASNRKFTPAEGVEVPEGYVDRMVSIVTNKVKFSRMVQTTNFFADIQSELDLIRN
jgi:lipoteichoic acid synthase